MQTSIYQRRESSGIEVSPLVMIAIASFLAGFGGFLLFGLNALN